VDRLVRVIDAVSDWSGRLLRWLAIPLVGGLVYEVVARYVFDAPTIWAYDITYMLYGSLFMLGAAYTLYKQGHIRTDILYRLLPQRWQGIVDAALYLVFFFPAVAFLLVVGIDFAAESWSIRERTTLSAWRPPVYPLKTVIPVAAFLLLVQGVAELLKSVRTALRGRWQ
jgi:TRAP-type mannitol/chloroaromatic compound transport system permease small subunit